MITSKLFKLQAQLYGHGGHKGYVHLNLRGSYEKDFNNLHKTETDYLHTYIPSKIKFTYIKINEPTN